MKILHTVEFYEPSRGGAQEVIRQISERLVRRGHEVTVATSFLPARTQARINGVEIAQFKIGGSAVKGVSGDTAAYEDFLLQSRFDVMMNYAAQVWTTDMVFPLLDRLQLRRVIMPLGYSRLHHPRYQEYFRALPGYLEKYDVLAYTSPDYQDKRFGDDAGLAGKSVIIPNGASEEEFSAPPIGFRERFGITQKHLFITVANHYFEKGHLDVIRAFRAAATDDCALVIIGERPWRHGWYSCATLCNGASKLDRRIHSIAGLTRPWIVGAYQEADLFLFGSKVECAPLVMYESFASKTPFVTTDVGNVKDHREVITLVRDRDDLASAIRAYLGNPAVFRQKAAEAHALYERAHTWEQLTNRFEALYQSLLPAPSPPPDGAS